MANLAPYFPYGPYRHADVWGRDIAANPVGGPAIGGGGLRRRRMRRGRKVGGRLNRFSHYVKDNYSYFNTLPIMRKRRKFGAHGTAHKSIMGRLSKHYRASRRADRHHPKLYRPRPGSYRRVTVYPERLKTVG